MTHSEEGQSHGWRRGVPLRGIVPPLVTPLASRHDLDVAGLERLVEHQVKGGVHGLFLLGTTGEAVSLALPLRRALIDRAIGCVQRRVPILVGVTDNAIAESIALADYAANAGADAIVVTSPFYAPIDQSELATYIGTIARETSLPLFLYNMPRLTKTWFEVDTIRQLMEVPQIVGIKDSSGDVAYLRKVCDVAKERADWSVLVGSEELLVEAISMGACGCVGGGANVWPRLLVQLYDAACAQDADQIGAVQQQLDKLSCIHGLGLYAAGSIRGLKCALETLGICSGRMAEPFAACSASQRAAVEEALQNAGLAS